MVARTGKGDACGAGSIYRNGKREREKREKGRREGSTRDGMVLAVLAVWAVWYGKVWYVVWYR